MKISRKKNSDKIEITVDETEYLVLRAGLRSAASDISKNSLEYLNYYTSERDDVVKMWNGFELQDELLT